MKLKINILTTKGHYAEAELEVPTVARISEAVLTFMDRLPDTIDGERVIDWTKILVEVERKG